jgi:hypothetical protein
MKNIFLYLIAMMISNLAYSGELEIRKEIQQDAKNLLLKKEYSMLNKKGSNYLKDQSRTSSGLWKLTIFYSALNTLMNNSIGYSKDATLFKTWALEWIAADQDASFPHIYYANILISEAWSIRGGGWASEVKKESWKPFHEKLEEARLYLVEHERFKEVDPQWYETMLTLANAQSWDHLKFYQLLNEALEKYPQFYELYFRGINYLQPRWHGSVDEIEKFVTAMTRKTEKHEGNGMYARIYWYASQTEFGFDLFTKSDVRWNQMKLGIDDVLKKYPDQWNINNFALFACLAKDAAKTKSLLNMIEGEPMKEVWSDNKMFENCKSLSLRSI